MRHSNVSALVVSSAWLLLAAACGGSDLGSFGESGGAGGDGGDGSGARASGAGASGAGASGPGGSGSTSGSTGVSSGASTGGGESTPCRPGATIGCYSGPSGTLDVGLCVGGLQTCDADGVGYGPCEGEVTPTDETCGTAGDDDCDGQTNEEGQGCSCVPSSVTSCYSAPEDTEGVGLCHAGTQTCNEAGTGYGPCQGEVTPAIEGCATKADEDCDGDPKCVPVVLADDEDYPTAIAVNATHVYWATSGTAPDYLDGAIRRVPIGGGAAVSIMTPLAYPTSLAIDASNVYFTSGSMIYMTSLAGGTLYQLASGLSYPEDIALDATYVYVAASTILGKMPKGGGALVSIASGESYVNRVAVLGANAYWLNNGTFATMKNVATTGGTKTTLWTSVLQSEQPNGIEVDATHVFWATRGNTGGGSVRKTSLTGSGTTTLSAGQYSNDVALDATFVYWTNLGTGSPFTDGTVRRVAKAGGAAVTLASGEFTPSRIAVDGTSVYYTTQTQIRKVGKD